MRRLGPSVLAALIAAGAAGASSAQTPKPGPVSVFADACLSTRGDIDRIDALAERRGWRRPSEARALIFLDNMFPAPEASVFQVGTGVVLTIEDRPKPRGSLQPQRLCRIWFTTHSAEHARRELEQVTIDGTLIGPPQHAYNGFGFGRIRNWRAGVWSSRELGYRMTLAAGRSPGRDFDFNTLIQVSFEPTAAARTSASFLRQAA